MNLLLPWLSNLPLQQQAVLVMACRGFDGSVKHSAHKPIVRTLRAHVFMAAQFGRPWEVADGHSNFMTLDYIKTFQAWAKAVEDFMSEVDSYNTHALMHLMHAAQVLGYKLPNGEYRERWRSFYEYFCIEVLHTPAETAAGMDERLCDWGQRDWQAHTVSPGASTVRGTLPATGPYVDRLNRIFRDRSADDTSAVVLQDYARAALAGAKA